jgi:pyruvate kinase
MLLEAARIGCTLPSIFQDVKSDDRILFDDGKIEGRIREIYDDHVVIEITRAHERGSRLQADKGINLPDSELKLDALTDKDKQDLKFIVQHADIVAYSFVRRAEDVHGLQQQLHRLGRPRMGIVLKIENRQACERLPSILLAAMRSPAAGVMIARGDLFVEVGYQRLAEIQEEILWMCEAAYMPVIWATQVLENLAKEGLPSRAEVTDAAMSVRAECVMLNKGPHILKAVQTLDDIISRMQDHQLKKRPLLRRLRLADDLQPVQ